MAKRYQSYFYSYDHPVSGSEVQFMSTDPDIKSGVYMEGQMLHYHSHQEAFEAAQPFASRQLWIVPIRRL